MGLSKARVCVIIHCLLYIYTFLLLLYDSIFFSSYLSLCHLSASLPLVASLLLLLHLRLRKSQCEGLAVWAVEWRRPSPLSELSFTKELPSSAALPTSSASSECTAIFMNPPPPSLAAVTSQRPHPELIAFTS